MISSRLSLISEKIAQATKRSGRNPLQDITLICVTKTAEVQQILEAVKWGVQHVGENRVQAASEKFAFLKDKRLNWHMIGHLQANKVKRALKFFDTIHSVDGIELAEKINKELSADYGSDKKISIFVEVNTSGESAKFGVREKDDLFRLMDRLGQMPLVLVEGLMTMAPFSDNPQNSRPYFEKLRLLKEDINKRNIDGIDLQHLSMGMSQDFEVAIEEGATQVRIGSAIFDSNYIF